MKDVNDKNLALGAILLAAVFGGGIAVFAKIGEGEISPFLFTFLRFLIASICLLPFFFKSRPKLDRQTFKPLAVSLLGTLNVALFAFGIRLTGATISQFLYSCVPVITVILSFFLLNEKLNRKKITGIVLGFVGVMIIIYPAIAGNRGLSGSLLGNSLIFMGVICYSLYGVFSKKLSKNYSPIQLNTFFSLTTGAVMFLLIASDLLINKTIIPSFSLSAWGAVLYVGLLGSAVYYSLMQYAIKHGTPLISSMTLFLQPSTTFLWAFFLLGESLTPSIIFGGILTLLGAWVTSQGK